MYDEDAEVCAEGDKDGVQGFVLLEGCVICGKLESCSLVPIFAVQFCPNSMSPVCRNQSCRIRVG